MKRIAILGGGISGLTAAYELELARKRGVAIDWHLYEASDRLGGIIETTRIPSPAGEYILEGGPDGWVSEKPWARELAVELGLESELIYSEDATRKTYVERDGQLLPIPDRMRFMVPEDLAVLEGSPLFSDSACAAYALELANASQLKASALPEGQDESVASFVRRHFGEEVVHTLAAPLLAGVFGGDVDKLSVRAVMPQMVALEREHGSLIAGLAAKSKARAGKPPVAIFTSLRRGMASLVEALVSALPAHRVHRNHRASKLAARDGWRIYFEGHRADPSIPIATIMPPATPDNDPSHRCEHLILATDLGTTRRLGSDLHPAIGSLFPQRETDVSLLPRYSSSAMLAAFTWPAELASAFTIPQGFGFVVPPHRQRSEVSAFRSDSQPLSLLAATFVDQKFPHRTPHGARRRNRSARPRHSAERPHQSSPPQTVSACGPVRYWRISVGRLASSGASTVASRRWRRSSRPFDTC